MQRYIFLQLKINNDAAFCLMMKGRIIIFIIRAENLFTFEMID
jgi:hypothetical protein